VRTSDPKFLKDPHISFQGKAVSLIHINNMNTVKCNWMREFIVSVPIKLHLMA
jgi:hypothetical protein